MKFFEIERKENVIFIKITVSAIEWICFRHDFESKEIAELVKVTIENQLENERQEQQDFFYNMGYSDRKNKNKKRF